MGKVIISPNIKKTSDRIDPAGNIIDKRTKQIIKPVEVESTPPPAPVAPTVAPATPASSKIADMVNKKVAEKVEEIVAQKVEEALSKL